MPHPSQDAHRSDIDGLRALAVLLVIVHHVAPVALPGGFAGVDVFFVLSGYLMTGIIDRAQVGGTFAFTAFMWRRARRIVPPLVAMLLATVVAGACILTAPEFAALGRHVIAGSLSVSNILLLTESGYFDTAAALKPLLHLWSLGVEEQFYLLWPLLLAAMPSRVNGRLLCVLALTAASLLVSENLAYSASAQGFYLLHSRAWEFGLGAALALMPAVPRWLATHAPSRAQRLLDVASVAGLSLIVGSAAVVNGTTAWPGVSAVPVAIGTVLVLAAGQPALVNRAVLSQPVARWVGERSYALYLWHWPPLAFLHVLAAERGWNADVITGASILLMFPALWLAHLSQEHIERPLREHTQRGEIRLRDLRPYAVALGVMAVTGAAVLGVRGMPMRYGAAGIDATRALVAASPDSIAAYDREATHCRLADKGFATWCRRVGGRGRGIAVFGDSHAEVVFAGLHALRPTQPMLLTGRKGCAPILQDAPLAEQTAETCRKAAQLAHATILADSSIATVVIASRGPAYLSGVGYGTDTLHRVVPVALGDTTRMRDAFERGLVRAIEAFVAAGKRVVLVQAVPEVGFQPDECIIGRPFGLRQLRQPCAVPRHAFDKRNAAYRALLARVATRVPSLEVFDPTATFCDASACRVTEGTTVLYSDGNHLTIAGSRRVASRLLPLLGARPAPSALASLP